MKCKIFSPEQQRISSWSGGQTRELYIAGGAADYAARDFLLRLSSATVETDHSAFTSLPSYHRALMALSGTVRLAHDGGRPVALSPFQVDVFDGGAATESWGRCQDFNVMWAKGAPFDIALEAPTFYPCQYNGADEDFYYAYRGEFLVEANHREYRLVEGELMHLEGAGYTRVRQVAREPGQMIHVAIQKRDTRG